MMQPAQILEVMSMLRELEQIDDVGCLMDAIRN
jgi:hypothetical protein